MAHLALADAGRKLLTFAKKSGRVIDLLGTDAYFRCVVVYPT